MNRDTYNCTEFAEAVESYLDGDLDSAFAESVEAHAESCPACAAELALATRVRAGLRSLPSLEAPTPAVEAVLTRVREEIAQANRFGWPRARPLLAAAAAVAALAIALAIFFARAPAPETQLALDDPAVVRATLETKLALAHFAQASRRVGRGLGDDLLRERLVQPMARSVATSLDGRGKPEQSRGVDVPERG